MRPRGAVALLVACCIVQLTGGNSVPIQSRYYSVSLHTDTVLRATVRGIRHQDDDLRDDLPPMIDDDGPTAWPTPAPTFPTPGPTPAGLPYWKDCSAVRCDYLGDHHVRVWHGHLEKHGPYHRCNRFAVAQACTCKCSQWPNMHELDSQELFGSYGKGLVV